MRIKNANDLDGELDSLMKFRCDVTSAAIHAHEDNAGGLRYDEVAYAVKQLGKRLAKLEAERDELTTEVERLGTALVEVRDRIDSLLASRWLGLEDG